MGANCLRRQFSHNTGITWGWDVLGVRWNREHLAVLIIKTVVVIQKNHIALDFWNSLNVLKDYCHAKLTKFRRLAGRFWISCSNSNKMFGKLGIIKCQIWIHSIQVILWTSARAWFWYFESLDAIASSSIYPCQSEREWAIDSFRFLANSANVRDKWHSQNGCSHS